ncbi:hypothetical protein [Salidesulfovibrio brasiliensis]|uniref:hypothetical protein n=1 Tax=Salidesulfovibrio brasiliensis TaxID=221711 RepID=UPI0006D028C6|nr:hypothetical protein [Salidesulfovibrio brasiliensis]
MKRILEHRLALLRAAVLTASLFGLSGCVAAIAPLLSLGGAVTAAPAVQVAATAFSVGEYCYEYSENDRNPVEVVEYKLAKVSDFLDGEETEVPQAEAPVMLAEPDSRSRQTAPNASSAALNCAACRCGRYRPVKWPSTGPCRIKFS